MREETNDCMLQDSIYPGCLLSASWSAVAFFSSMPACPLLLSCPLELLLISSLSPPVPHSARSAPHPALSIRCPPLSLSYHQPSRQIAVILESMVLEDKVVPSPGSEQPFLHLQITHAPRQHLLWFERRSGE
jgi:hypothetical protein